MPHYWPVSTSCWKKPPGSTLGEVETLRDLAAERGLTLFAAWHSRFAPGVELARVWLRDRLASRVVITWHEDVRVWHPGQRWIWEAGGFGVFDPGINALSIATHILPSFYLANATLCMPSNAAAPVAARLRFQTEQGAPIDVSFDFRAEGNETWTIEVQTIDGILLLDRGGASLSINGASVDVPNEAEYPALYAYFGRLISARQSDVDVRPLQHVCRRLPACPL